MTVFVVIVTYKGSQWYERCFTSLRQSNVPVTTVVVDNASQDGTIEYIREHFPEIHLIESEKNLGFGGANNIGIRYALDQGCDYCFLLNQDAWIEPDTMAELIRISQAYPEYGILSPVHLNKEKTNVEKWLLQRLDDFRTTNSSLFDDLYFGRLKDVYRTKYVNAAAWFMPRKTLETIGGFDPIFFHYGEDDNYINRVLYHGLKIGICPRLQIVHDNDRPRPLYDSREHEVLMLINYTNVNARQDIQRDIRWHRMKAVKSFIRGRRSAAKQYYADFKWLKDHRNEIINSLEVNRKKGKNWL